MRVRACDLGYPEMTRDFQREHVFVLAAGAVEHFDRIDQLEDSQLGRAVRVGWIDRLRVRVDKRKARVEFVAERMIRDQDPAFQIDHAPQFRQLVDSPDVPLEPERADVTHVGRHFHPAQKDHARVARHRGDFARVPHIVVLGDADRADSDRTRALDQIFRREVRVRAAAIGVQMQVNAEVGPRRLRVPAS